MTTTLTLIGRDATPDTPPLPGGIATIDITPHGPEAVEYAVTVSPRARTLLAPLAGMRLDDDPRLAHDLLPRYELTEHPAGHDPAFLTITIDGTPLIREHAWIHPDWARGARAALNRLITAAG